MLKLIIKHINEPSSFESKSILSLTVFSAITLFISMLGYIFYSIFYKIGHSEHYLSIKYGISNSILSSNSIFLYLLNNYLFVFFSIASIMVWLIAKNTYQEKRKEVKTNYVFHILYVALLVYSLFFVMKNQGLSIDNKEYSYYYFLSYFFVYSVFIALPYVYVLNHYGSTNVKNIIDIYKSDEGKKILSFMNKISIILLLFFVISLYSSYFLMVSFLSYSVYVLALTIKSDAIKTTEIILNSRGFTINKDNWDEDKHSYMLNTSLDSSRYFLSEEGRKNFKSNIEKFKVSPYEFVILTKNGKSDRIDYKYLVHDLDGNFLGETE